MLSRIKEYGHNLRYLHGKQTIPLPLYIFLYFTIATGVSFLFLLSLNSDQGITMYEVMLATSGVEGTMMWAWMTVAVGVGSIVSIATRAKLLAELCAFIGFGLWFYLAWVYGLDGYWDGVMLTTLPNMIFWIWYSMKVEFYKKVL